MVTRILLVTAILLVVLGSAGIAYQYQETRSDKLKYPPLGKLIDLGSHKLHLLATGEKSRAPTVILEAGFGGSAIDWILVQPDIAKFAHVCSYDRAGYGWSEESSAPRTAENIVKELHALMHCAQIMPPYILVGHSLGGCFVQLYATKYPDEVAGLILVDSAHENQLNELPKEILAFHENIRKVLWISKSFLAPFGLIRLFGDHIFGPMKEPRYPEEISDMSSAHMCQTKCLSALYEESAKMGESFAQIKQTSRSYGDIPLIVIGAGNFNDLKQSGISKEVMESLKALRTKYHNDLIARSTKGKLLMAPKSSHLVHIDQPEIIVEAVRSLMQDIASDRKNVPPNTKPL